MSHKTALNMNARERRSLKRAQARMKWALENRMVPEKGMEAGEKELHRPLQSSRNTAARGVINGRMCSA